MKRKAIYKDHKVEVLNIDMQNVALIVYPDGTTDNVGSYYLKFLPQEHESNSYNLSKREQIAAMAMHGMLVNSFSYGISYSDIAHHSIKQADALINELKKEKEGSK